MFRVGFGRSVTEAAEVWLWLDSSEQEERSLNRGLKELPILFWGFPQTPILIIQDPT